MLKDITFGQYLPTNSVIHQADPRTKLLLLLALIVIIFLAGNAWTMLLLAVAVLGMLAVSKIPLKMYLKNLKSILPIILFTSVLNALYVSTGTVLWQWWVITVTTDGVWRALFMSLRICLLILASALFSYSTTPTAITAALEQLLSPLKYIGLQSAVHTMAMTMTIALRFIPTLIEETGIIMNAQKARGADLESGGLLKRMRALLPILIPLLISAIRRAYDLAEAMESRCYNGAEGRQRMKKLKMGAKDAICALVVVALGAATVVLNILF